MQIDRYVADRRKKQKKRRKYFWSIAGFLVLYFILLGIFLFVVRSPAFQAEKITVQGESAVSQAQILNLLHASVLRKDASLNEPNSGLKAFLGFNNLFIWPDTLPSSTVADIPQLSAITISKDYFLHTITVTATERQPFAVWCLMSTGQCYWFDYQGTVFAPAEDTEGNAITVIHDYSQKSLAINGSVLPSEFVPNLISIINVLKQSNINAEDIALNDLSLQQINITTANGPMLYFSLRFSADEDLGVLQNLMAQGGFDKLQYVDFTVENRAYYK